jgi:hypothetical protein
VRRSAGATFTKVPLVTTVDQFGSQSMALLRPRYLCVPANKNNEDPGALSSTNNLLCYKAKHTKNFPEKDLFLDNQFIDREAEIIRFQEFCVPTQIQPVN